MYQQSILKTIILNPQPAIFNKIDTRADLLFQDEDHLGMYQEILSYYQKFDRIPSQDYLYQRAKHYDAEYTKYLDQLFDDSVQVSDDLEAIIELQISINVKLNVSPTLKDYSTKIKNTNPEQLEDKLSDLQDTVSDYVQRMTVIEHKQHLVSGETALNRLQARYNKSKKDDSYYVCKYGKNGLDSALTGINKTDFIGILGYTNQGKTPATIDIAYNALMQGLQVMHITLEISYDAVENSYLTLHANNNKIWGFNKPKIGLQKVREGNLSEMEEAFFLNEVAYDFMNNEAYGNLYIHQP